VTPDVTGRELRFASPALLSTQVSSTAVHFSSYCSSTQPSINLFFYLNFIYDSGPPPPLPSEPEHSSQKDLEQGILAISKIGCRSLLLRFFNEF
jgi:hypothetical protein